MISKYLLILVDSCMKKNILIIGSNSLIGNDLRCLDLSAYNLYFTSRKSEHSECSRNTIKYDLEDKKKLKLDIEFEWCIYLADLPLIKGLFNSGIKFKNLIAFSTSSVLTKVNSSHIKDKNLLEEFTNAENLLVEQCNYQKFGCYVFRPTLIYSLGKDKNVTVINNFIKKYKFFPKIGNFTGLRQPIASSCLAQLIRNAISKQPSPGFVKFYQVAGQETMTFKEMVEKLFYLNMQKPIFIPINKTFFYYVLKTANLMGFFKNISFDMIDHASMNFNFSNKEIYEDFKFKPKNFLEKL